MSTHVSRRDFLVHASVLATAVSAASEVEARGQGIAPHQAMGTRVGDVTPTSAIVWTRLTRNASRLVDGISIPGRAQDSKGKPLPAPTVPVDQLEGACPGAPGRARIVYGTNAELRDARSTDWVEVDASSDFIHQFHLRDLEPGATYHFVSECASLDGKIAGTGARGRFRVAPRPAAAAPVRFCVMTCQGYPDRGHPDGHGIYPSMLALDPDFACLTGDLVYYDNDMPRATSPRLARLHWERMFSLPRLVDFNRSVGAYWLKDDHDTLDNDSWPGRTMGDLTFEQGQRIFREQAPMEKGPAYRTFRWGRDLQIWLAEGRDFRSANTRPDGADKTIWGAEQIAWFQRSVLASDATWRILVSPTPFVGPDRPQGKNDNHSNRGFQHEGDALRGWMREHLSKRFLVICGDRHWQYHSVHPETGLHEFSVGAASDEHAGGSPGLDRHYHRFHRVAGGFLSVTIDRDAGQPRLTCRHHDVAGRIVYEYVQTT